MREVKDRRGMAGLDKMCTCKTGIHKHESCILSIFIVPLGTAVCEQKLLFNVIFILTSDDFQRQKNEGFFLLFLYRA